MKRIHKTIIGFGLTFAGGAGIVKAIMIFVCMFSIGLRIVAPPEMRIILGNAPHIIGIDNSIFAQEFLKTDFSQEELKELEETQDMMEEIMNDLEQLED